MDGVWKQMNPWNYDYIIPSGIKYELLNVARLKGIQS